MSRRRARERWMKRMEAAGRRAAGRQCTLAVHSQCGRHVLSPPQRATAAKQAKCRQTFGSTWVPHIRSPGVAVGAGWLGTRGRTGASLPFCGCSGVEVPGPAAPGRLHRRARRGGLALVSGCRSVRIRSQRASAAPSRHPELEECSKGKSQRKGCARHNWGPQVPWSPRALPPPLGAWRARPGCLPLAVAGDPAAGQGDQGCLSELSTPEATACQGRGEKAPREMQRNFCLKKQNQQKIPLLALCGVGCCDLVSKT